MALAYQEFYTVDDYMQWEGKWELMDGMPYAMAPSPSVSHQVVSLNVASTIKASIKNKPNCCNHCCVLMETDWHVSNDTVVRPDVMIVCQDIAENVVVTPELIIEVVSPSSTKRDEVMKFDLYQREGVLYYLLIYPDKRLIKIYKNQSEGFKRLNDCSDAAMVFAFGKCDLNVDLSSIWR